MNIINSKVKKKGAAMVAFSYLNLGFWLCFPDIFFHSPIKRQVNISGENLGRIIKD